MSIGRRPRYVPPIPTKSMTKAERQDLIDSGSWRVFRIGKEEFITSRRADNPPIIIKRIFKGMNVNNLPRPTYSLITKGPLRGKRMDLIAWPYSTMTVQDFDYAEFIPRSISKLKKVVGYTWTTRGVHIYQKGKQDRILGSDPEYERISKEERRWYGDAIRNYDGTEVRTLVTTNARMARVWLLGGGRVRLVNDIVKSYGSSYASMLIHGILKISGSKSRARKRK